MEKLDNKKASVTLKRKLLIRAFYKYQLMNADLNYIKQELLDDNQEFGDEDVIAESEAIVEHQDEIISEIKANLSSKWNWNRIPAVIRAVLLVGAYEIKFTSTPKPVTINEMVNYTKSVDPNFDFGFVNAALDKIIKL